MPFHVPSSHLPRLTWLPHLSRCSEKVQEPRLAMHYASLQKSLSIKKEEWDKYNQSRYNQWLTVS